MSELAKYAHDNPDSRHPGCRNTGALEDGVVFPGFEPMIGHVGFIGRTSIIEAVGELYGLTPDDVRASLEEGTPRQKAALARRDDEIASLKAEIARIQGAVQVALHGAEHPAIVPGELDVR